MMNLIFIGHIKFLLIIWCYARAAPRIAVLASGEGTIHHVTDEYDAGAIICCPCLTKRTETLIEELVKTIEKQLIFSVIQNWNYVEADEHLE